MYSTIVVANRINLILSYPYLIFIGKPLYTPPRTPAAGPLLGGGSVEPPFSE